MLEKLKKIDFKVLMKNQKFMIPIVVFPFLMLINGLCPFIFKTDLKAATPMNAGSVFGSTNQMNTELQDPDLEKSQTKNKFDALFDAYDKKEDFSAIQDLEGLGSGSEKSMELDDKNLYSMSEMEMISKGNGSRLTSNGQNQAPSNYSLFKNAASNSPSNGLGYSPKFATHGSQTSRVDNTEINKGYAQRDNYESHLNSLNNSNDYGRNYDREQPKERSESRQTNPHEDNMALFRAQMAVIDSMTNKRKDKRSDKTSMGLMNLTDKGELSEALSEGENVKPLVKSTAKSAMNTDKIIEVSKTENDNSRYFNTVGLSKINSFIKAILDEGLKVYDGSRVRIRLLDDIQFEGKTLERGTYLYGIISGFKTQRVLLTITNIAYNNEILNVKLDVFDQDGMKGLYIPESLFREIAKEANAQTVGGQNMQFSDNNALNATQMAYTAAQDIYKTTTRAMSDAIRKRKAVLKYNTQIFLVNSK